MFEFNNVDKNPMHLVLLLLRTRIFVLTLALLLLMSNGALANFCSIVLIKDGKLDMLDIGPAITLAEQCHAQGEPVPDDPCDIRLFYKPGGLIENLPGTQAALSRKRKMMQACVRNRMAAIEALAQAQRDLTTPLHDAIAARQGPMAVAKILEETGQKYVNVTDTEGVTPLHSIMKHGAALEIVRHLLNAGADPNAESEEIWPVFYSAIGNNASKQVLSLLIEAGADPGRTLINENSIGSLYRESNAVSIALRADYELEDLRWIYDQTGFDKMPYRRSYYYYAVGHSDPEALDFLSEVSDHPSGSREATEILFNAANDDAHPQVIAKLFELGADGSMDDLHHSNGRTVLHFMIHHPQKFETIKALVESGATMGEDRAPDYALRVAARRHPDPEVLRYLTTQYTKQELRRDLWAVIGEARKSRQNAAIKVALLEELDFELEFLDCEDGCPDLLGAVAAGHSVDNLRRVLKAGGDINAVSYLGDGPLHLALKGKDAPKGVIAFLAKAGADPNLRNNAGQTPLIQAVDLGKDGLPSVVGLLSNGADPNLQNEAGKAPLVRAIELGSNGFAAAIELLSNGANPNTPDANGVSLVFKTIYNDGALAMLKALIEANVDLAVTDKTGQTPIFALLSKPLNVYTQTYLKVLLENPHDTAATDKDGKSALCLALEANQRRAFHPFVIKELLKAGHDPNVIDRENSSALHLAIANGHHPDTVEALLDAGVDMGRPNADGFSPLKHAIVRGSPVPVTTALLAHGADPNEVDESGQSPLHWAAMNGAAEPVFAALLEHGADPKLRAPAGKMPIQLVNADHENYDAVQTVLRANGGGTNFIREWHYRGLLLPILAGILILLAVALIGGFMMLRRQRAKRHQRTIDRLEQSTPKKAEIWGQ